MNKSDKSIHEYWPRYWKRNLFFVVSMQLIGVLIVSIALLLTGIVDPIKPAFWITIVAIVSASIGVNILALGVTSEPLKQLTAALAHAKGERSPLLPPNPNTNRYKESGLRPLLLAILELGVQDAGVYKNTKPETVSFDIDFKSAFEETKAGVVFLNQQREVLFANSSAPVREDPTGTRKLELEFYTDQSLDEWLKQCEEKAVHAQKVWKHIANKPMGHEDRRTFDISASYEKGSAIPVVVILIDKTEDYRPEDEDLNFIAFAAHELRGPITVIRGYLDALNDELASALDAEQKELFKRLIVSANRLSSYINNILNSSRYDRRHLNLHLTESSVRSIYALIQDDMQLRASSLQRLLSVDIPANLPTVAADPTSVSEVISNLIDNAIKYSREGGAIEVTAEIQGNFVEVSVTDHGIGMPANVVSNLFHKFYRSHRSREAVPGTGIGLYISKAIVESHGGNMLVRSVENEGSTFSFTLPIYASVAEKIQKSGGANQTLIQQGSTSWIKNHGQIRG